MKWADYVIVAVQYNNNLQIEKVQRCPDLGDKLGDVNIEARERIMAGMQKGVTHVTAYKNENDNTWRKGDVVDIVNLDGTDFIRTDNNDSKEDNLGNLPRF